MPSAVRGRLLLLRRGLGRRALERRQPPGAVDQPDAERRDAEDLFFFEMDFDRGRRRKVLMVRRKGGLDFSPAWRFFDLVLHPFL